MQTAMGSQESSEKEGVDVLLVVVPFGSVDKPSLGPAILTSACRARGLSVRTINAPIMLAERAGYEAYYEASMAVIHWMAGERVFLPYAYPAAMAGEFDAPVELPGYEKRKIDAIAPHVAPFLDDLVARVLAARPRILGLSSTFQQNLACSALAHRIKAASPETVIVMGGANVMEPMGSGLAHAFPWIDHFFSGESEIAFPDFCERYLRDGVLPEARIVACPPLWDLRKSFAPEFDDYFEELRAAQARGTLPDHLPTSLTIETSRGCWWGAKNHCTFCGLNGETMAFREKPPETALAEIETLSAQWGVPRFAAADNIMPVRYYKEFLPVLAEREERLRIFYEVKANLTEAQVAMLASAGVTVVQPGIESLSTGLLKLLRKGVSAHQNLSLLRNGRTYGVRILWNLLHGMPGESAEEHRAVLELMPLIEHFQPAKSFSGIVLDRYSPYFNEFESFGIERIKPMRGYQGLFPRNAPLQDIAYHFSGAYSTELIRDPELGTAIRRQLAAWQLQWLRKVPPMLVALGETADGVEIADTRTIAGAERTVISHRDYALLRACDRARQPDAVAEFGEDRIAAMIAAKFLLDYEGLLLNLVTRGEAAMASDEAAEEIAA